jgi:hypothetical protein
MPAAGGRRVANLPKTVLFHRTYKKFRGGHLKVKNYLDHVKSSPAYDARIVVDDASGGLHLWQDDACLVEAFDPAAADILFVASKDWRKIPAGLEDRIPVVNLVQGVQHADPEDARHEFLGRKAVRICVSPDVAGALVATGACNGPIHVIANSIDAADLPVAAAPVRDVFIGGAKAPEIARSLAARLEARGLGVDCLVGTRPRPEFLQRMAAAEIVVLLPKESEGFFLPALEAMMIGRAVVCTDGVGNRSFCIDGETCLMPARDVDRLDEAVVRLHGDAELRRALRERAATVVTRFDIARERSAFLGVLNRLAPRNVAITGLPRSGTTLACNLLNQVPNVVALHEPMPAGELRGLDEGEFLRRAVRFFEEQRASILAEGVAVSKSAGGRVPQNPLADSVVDGKRKRNLDGRSIVVDNVTSPGFDLCIKHPSMFTARLPQMVDVFDCYGLVRNPLSVLLSWRDCGMPVAKGRIPAAEGVDRELAARLEAQESVLDRQLVLIDYFFGRFAEYLPDRVVKYEDVIATGGRALQRIVPAAANLDEPLVSRNDRALGQDADALRIAERLLREDSACWHFYERADVEALVAGVPAAAGSV